MVCTCRASDEGRDREVNTEGGGGRKRRVRSVHRLPKDPARNLPQSTQLRPSSCTYTIIYSYEHNGTSIDIRHTTEYTAVSVAVYTSIPQGWFALPLR